MRNLSICCALLVLAVVSMQTSAQSRAEMQARQEVEQSIADYCAARSDRDFIQLCTSRER